MINSKQIVKFLLAAFALYFVWFIVYDYYIQPDGRVNNWLNLNLARSGTFLLNIFGYDADTIIEGNQLLITINSIDLLGVGDSCNGLELYVLFSGFIICFPGPVTHKLWYIPAGIIAIDILNSFRAAALSLNQFYHPQSLQFNHHYTFTIIVYAFIFYLWIVWTNRFAKNNSLRKNYSVNISAK